MKALISVSLDISEPPGDDADFEHSGGEFGRLCKVKLVTVT